MLLCETVSSLIYIYTQVDSKLVYIYTQVETLTKIIIETREKRMFDS